MKEKIGQKPDDTEIRIRELLKKHGSNIENYAVCALTESVHDQPRTTYIGKGQSSINPELIPPSFLRDLGMPNWFCEEHRAELGIKTALGMNIDDIKNISYFVIPEGKEFGTKDVKNVLEKYEKKELNYHLQNYNESLLSQAEKKIKLNPRQAIVFYEKNLSSEVKENIYKSLKSEAPTISILGQSGRSNLSAELDEVFKAAEKGPSLTNSFTSSPKDYENLSAGIARISLLVELAIPIKQEYATAINGILNGAGQLAYRIDVANPSKVYFFTDKFPEYADSQLGKEKIESAIKGIRYIQSKLEVQVAKQSLEDKSTKETA